jgi:4-hydroxy-tetrahydrodipicolinate synthase
MIKGIITPVVTLLNENKEIDFRANELVIKRLIDANVNGIVLLGSTGEFPLLKHNEKRDFIENSLKYINNETYTIVNISSTVLEESESLIKWAEKYGASAIMAIAPYYFSMDELALYSYFSHLAKLTDLPVMLYNFPDRNSINLMPEFILKLAENHKNIIGVKDTVDNMSHTRKIILQFKEFNREFFIFSGLDEYLIPNLFCGGSGSICGLSNIFPKLYVKIWDAFNNKNMGEIINLQRDLMILLELFEITNPFTISIKYALKCAGLDIKPVVKYPDIHLSENQLNRIKFILQRLENYL